MGRTCLSSSDGQLCPHPHAHVVPPSHESIIVPLYSNASQKYAPSHCNDKLMKYTAVNSVNSFIASIAQHSHAVPKRFEY